MVGRGFVAHTLQGGRCDLVMGLVAGIPGVITTAPYYRSSYMFLYRKAAGIRVKSLNDPALRRLRIGIHVVDDNYAPPAAALARRGIIAHLKGYSLFGRYGDPNPSARILEAVARGDIDLAIVWGPLAGYSARREGLPLELVPVSPQIDSAVPMTYSIAIGVRPGDQALKKRMDRFVADQRVEIRRILKHYGVAQV